jgi:hypothetical protein
MGRTFSRSLTTSADQGGVSEPSVPAAKDGTLTTRTDDNTGVVTCSTGHGITNGKVDVYWDGGARRNMDATVATNAITCDGGAGDNLPVLNTAVTIQKVNTETVEIVGDDVVAFGVQSPTYPATVVFRQSDGTEIFAVELDAGESYCWSDQSAETNPLAGQTVGKITTTISSTAGAAPVYVGWVVS